MKIETLYRYFCENPIITTDSRNCQKGALFFALKGENFNGNFFAAKSLENGCRFAIIDDPQFKIDKRYILVDNVLQTLRDLAAYHRQQLKIPIIGITGTNGKTTTKELIAAVLSQKYNTLFTIGNLNNHIGVPLTLLKITPQHEIAIIEMGANHQGEISDSTSIVRPDFGIITNIGKAHLEGFGSFEKIVKTKGELYDFIRNNGGKIFLNKQNLNLQKIGEGIPRSTYAIDDETADVSGHVTSCSPFVEIEWHMQKESKTHHISTHFIGKYNVENMLAAICVGLYFRVPTDKISAAIETYTPQNNRSQLTKTKNNQLIIDTYNANPTSMEAALTNFAEMDFPHKTLLLGDMLELGEQSFEEHKKIIDLIEEKKFQQVYLVGRQFSIFKNKFQTFLNIDDFIRFANENQIKNSCILIKGSHGIKLEKAIEKL